MSVTSAKKQKKGRPTVDSEAVNVRLDRAMLTALDTWRRESSDLPNRPKAIRRLLEHGLKAVGAVKADDLPSEEHSPEA